MRRFARFKTPAPPCAGKKVITLDRLFNKNDRLKTNTALQMKDAGNEFKAV
jgi:hypothetical protein